MTESSTPPIAATITTTTRSYLSEARRVKLYDALMSIIPTLDNSESYDDRKLEVVIKRIEHMLEKAHKYGAYFGVKPWESRTRAVTQEVNFDFGLNPRAVLFPMYPENKVELVGSEGYENRLLMWYALIARNFRDIWSLSKIIRVKSIDSAPTFQSIIRNFKISFLRADSKECTMTLADLPWMNLADVNDLAVLLRKREKVPEIKWLTEYLEKFMELTFRDYAQQDRALGGLLKYRTKKPNVACDSLERLCVGQIVDNGKDPIGVYHELEESDGSLSPRFMRLDDLALFTSKRISGLLPIIDHCPVKSKHKKFVLSRMNWLLLWRAQMIGFAEEHFQFVLTEAAARIEANRDTADASGAGGSGVGLSGPIMF